jgi:hypothetical protein
VQAVRFEAQPEGRCLSAQARDTRIATGAAISGGAQATMLDGTRNPMGMATARNTPSEISAVLPRMIRSS